MTNRDHPELHLVVEAVRRATVTAEGTDAAAATAEAPPEAADTLAALEALHRLREQLAAWEPVLIESARDQGVSWARLAPVLGVTSRQAAERRYLRMRPGDEDGLTGEQRVQATRDERAGDRAVAAWARAHAGELRTIAGQVSGLRGLSRAGRRRARAVAGELTGDDPATLIEPLARIHADLLEDHAQLAAEVGDVGRKVRELRREAQRRRTTPD